VPVLVGSVLATLGLCAAFGGGAAAYAASPPSVMSVRPASGPGSGGTQVTIQGRNLAGATAVTFGAENAPSFTVRSATEISVTSPAGTGTVDLTVTTPAGTSADGAADRFTYLPVVTGVSPASGPVDGNTPVTITGIDFGGATAVEFGATHASEVTVVSPTQITADSPSEGVGKIHVRVTTPSGTSKQSSHDAFTFTPTIASVSPATGFAAGGTTVTVTGSGFGVGEAATRIKFGPRVAVSVQCSSATECVVVAPPITPGTEQFPTVDVRAQVRGIYSPATAADHFHYHGLYLRDSQGRLRVGADLPMRMSLGAPEAGACEAFISGYVAADGVGTDELDVTVANYPNCLTYEWLGELPEPFTLNLGDDGSASVEGPMGVRTGAGCVYEGSKLAGGFETGMPFEPRLSGTFALVAEEEAGAECSPTETVSLFIGSEHFLITELVG
jgi:IPT/TIG domain